MSFLDAAQGILTEGISAYRDIQQAKYQVNDPTPNNRGNNGITAPAGSYALADTLVATFTNPLNLVLLLAVGAGIYFLARR